jgi:hypothetical protein
MRSSPADLYALAVIAVRILLVNDETTLAIALDEIQSLAQSVADKDPQGVELSTRLRDVTTTDSRWSASLGPHRLLNPQALTPEEALTYLPDGLWWDTIAMVIRCFPGETRDSFAADLGDAPPLALDAVFESPIAALEKLSLRARSLLFVDWKYNSEITAVIQAVLQQHLEELSYKPGA